MAPARKALRLGDDRAAVARCIFCDAEWILVVRPCFDLVGGFYAHRPGTMNCPQCGCLGVLDATEPEQEPRERSS